MPAFRLRRPWLHAALGLLPVAALSVPLPVLARGDTTRISVASDGQEANYFSGRSSMSANGRYVAFVSRADNLVPGDTNGYEDIFVHDRQTGVITRVSVAPDGTQANNFSLEASISADGRYVAFESYASNLVTGDTNDTADVYVHDRQTGETTRVNVASDGTQANSGSDHAEASISADGRYVAFDSYASNLVPGDTNDTDDVFVHDRQTGETTRISVASDGTQGGYSSKPSISADGRYVAFHSAGTLVAGDTNGRDDVFVHDRQTRQTSRVSVDSDGQQANESSETSSISADGRYVVFQSNASNLVAGDTNGWWDIFVHDRQTRRTTRVNVASDGIQANSSSNQSSISADGRYVAFGSSSNNLAPGDTGNTDGKSDIFVHDRQTRLTTRVSVALDGNAGNSSSSAPSISADGRYVVFQSNASNLVPGDTNKTGDIFLRDRLLLPTKKADLMLTQRDSADPVHKGGLLSYTVTVKNRGPGPAYYVNLTELAPQNAQLLSVKPSYGICSRAAVSVCRLGTLAAGAQATVKVNLKATQLGVLSNTVSVNAAPLDLTPGNNVSTAKTWIIP